MDCQFSSKLDLENQIFMCSFCQTIGYNNSNINMWSCHGLVYCNGKGVKRKSCRRRNIAAYLAKTFMLSLERRARFVCPIV
jgi:hypothetical protein